MCTRMSDAKNSIFAFFQQALKSRKLMGNGNPTPIIISPLPVKNVDILVYTIILLKFLGFRVVQLFRYLLKNLILTLTSSLIK